MNKLSISERDISIKNANALSDDEYNKLVYSYNATEKKFNDNKLVFEAFEEKAIIFPNNIAVIDNDHKITYEELNNRANQLAHLYIQNGIGNGDIIAVIKDRSIDIIVTLLGILKSGATYVPIEPQLPLSRINSILESTKAKCITTDSKYVSKLYDMEAAKSVNIIWVANDINYINVPAACKNLYTHKEIYVMDKHNPKVSKKSTDLAYVIFTSGTTGVPKGVMISHNRVINIFEWMNNTFCITEKDKILFITSVGFDLSVYDIFGILSTGGTIRLAKENDISNPIRLLNIIEDEDITIWDSAPPALQLLMPHISNKKSIDSKLRLVFLSGDWIPVGMPNILQEKFKHVEVVSLGGATEATIWSNYYRIGKVDPSWKSIPYGKPIQNARYYILDEYLNPVQEGVEGNLYIGGKCLALGYINNEKLTNERFIDNPFINDEKIYMTGDVARWTDDGNMQLLGRSDDQVKVRGYRIELGEISSVLSKHPKITDCLVKVIKDKEGENQIVTYVIINDKNTSSEEEELINSWKSVYDSVYKDRVNAINPLRNYSGWKSSFTRENMLVEQMDEWLDCTLERIKLLTHGNVLELGCGTGMILLNIAPLTMSYTACDLSVESIKYIEKTIEENGRHYHNTILYNCPAHEFQMYDKKFDTVVMNSVCQYFPSSNYLIEVINNAVDHMEANGKIFIGDVRNLDLAESFYKSVIFSNSNSLFTEEEVKIKIEHMKANEKELLLSPDFFYNLANNNNRISSIKVLPKIGVHHTEMNLYRYDVIIYIDSKLEEQHIECLDFQDFVNDPDVLISIVEKYNVVLMKNVLDLRLIEFEKRLIDNKIDNNCYHKLKMLDSLSNTYTLNRFYVGGSNSKYYDVVVSNKKNDFIEGAFFSKQVNMYSIDENKIMANVPLKYQKEIEFITEIKTYLASQLPSYMIPSNIIVIDKIPVTINGKVDWLRLPIPNNNMINDNIKHATNEIEAVLIKLWCDILKLERAGTNFDFFEYGGHSLKANLLTLEIQKRLGVEITIRDIFKHSTPELLAKFIHTRDKSSDIQRIQKVEMEFYPATSEQERIYLAHSVIENNIAYNITDAVNIKGKIDVEKLTKAIIKVAKKHEAFRTSFIFKDNQLVQKIDQDTNIKIEIYNCEHTELTNKIKEFIRPFELSIAPLLRVAIINSNDDYVLVLDMHHIIMDGVSLGIFRKEISDAYNDIIVDENFIDYSHYSVWKGMNSATDKLNVHESYWTNRIGKSNEVSTFLEDYPRSTQLSYIGTNKFYKILPSKMISLKNTANDNNITLFSLLSSIYSIVLNKYTGNNDVIIGTVASNRNHIDTSKMIGMFVNTLAIKFKVDSDMKFIDYVKRCHEELSDDLLHQEYPLEKILQIAGADKLFSTVLAVQNMELGKYCFGDTSTQLLKIKSETAKFDLTLLFNQINADDIELEVEYSTELYKEETVDKIVSYLFSVMEQVINNENIRLKDILLDSKENLAELYNKLNNTTYLLKPQKPVHEIISDIALLYPEEIALILGDEALSYRQLSILSTAFVLRLQNMGFKKGDVIAVLMNSSFEMIITWIAVLKIGAVLLPISPDNPAERTNFILEDSSAKLVVCDIGDINEYKIQKLKFQLNEFNIDGASSFIKDIEVRLDDCAYIIYTSGSSGVPKGVKINHKSLTNLCQWHNDYFNVSNFDNSTKYAGEGFDASVWEVFPYLTAGATIHIINKDLKYDLEKLNEYFNKNNITISFLPTQVCEVFMKLNNKSLRYLLTGGDKLNYFRKNNYKVINNYGPTENTVVTTAFVVDDYYSNIPIGKPIYNTEVYVCDKDMNLLPYGVPGELIIGGENLSIGYVNNEKLNKDKFIMAKENRRLYKSGDRVRLTKSGDLEFLGRVDEQVKIRGYRIELGDIQNNIMNYNAISSCAVIVQNNLSGSNMLVCFYESKENIDVIKLKDYLSNKLSSYMIPQQFVRVDNMPLTPNGKIDKRKLSLLKTESNSNINTGILNNDEVLLLNAWKKAFGIDNIDLSQNFFELGGDSIKAMQIAAELHNKGKNIDVSSLLSNPTIKDSSKKIKSADSTIEEDLEGSFEALPIQKWYLNNFYKEGHYFNMSQALEFTQRVDRACLKNAIKKIIEHHDALRTIFRKKENGDWYQKILNIDDVIYNIECIELSDIEATDKYIQIIANNAQAKISVENDMLINVTVLKLKESDHVLISMHHLIVDAYSFRIIIQDLVYAYNQFINKQPAKLPKKTDSIKGWAAEINEGAILENLNKDIDYWNNLHSKLYGRLIKNIELENSYFSDSAFRLEYIGKEITQKLIMNKDKVKIDIKLLAALSKSINEVFSISDFLINLENYGRNSIESKRNISRTIGWFTSKYPVAISVDSEDNLYDLNMKLHEGIDLIPSKGFSYEVLKSQSKITAACESQISFNYLGQIEELICSSEIKYSKIPKGNYISNESNRFYDLDFNIAVINSEIEISVSYNKYEIDRSLINMVLDKFIENTTQIAFIDFDI